jgi:hypothetical protein
LRISYGDEAFLHTDEAFLHTECPSGAWELATEFIFQLASAIGLAIGLSRHGRSSPPPTKSSNRPSQRGNKRWRNVEMGH